MFGLTTLLLQSVEHRKGQHGQQLRATEPRVKDGDEMRRAKVCDKEDTPQRKIKHNLTGRYLD